MKGFETTRSSQQMDLDNFAFYRRKKIFQILFCTFETLKRYFRILFDISWSISIITIKSKITKFQIVSVRQLLFNSL